MASFCAALSVPVLPPLCRCCYADTETQVTTCSKPNTLLTYDVFGPPPSCPNPPAISINTQSWFGPLEGYDVYVDEHLLNISNYITTSVFHQRFVGGFVLHPPNPTYSTCGCQSREESCLTLTPALASTDLTQMDCCTLFSNLSVIDPCTDATEWSQTYDGVIDACLDFAMCTIDYMVVDQCVYPNLCIEPLVGKVAPPPPTIDEPTVTIWFNNQVRGGDSVSVHH